MCGPSGNSQLPPSKRRVSVPAGERDSSQGGSSVPSTIQCQNYTPSSLLNNSRVGDITQLGTYTQSATQRRSLITPTATSGISSCNTAVPSRTIQPDSTRRVVSSPTSGIASTPTPLRALENLPIPIPNPEAHTMITYPLRTQATEKNPRQRPWGLQPQAVSTPRLMVSGSRSIHRFGQSDMMYLVFAMGRLLELNRWNRRPFMSASDLEIVSYATQHIAKAFAEYPDWQIIDTYWNTAMPQNDIFFIAYEARTMEILNEVCSIDHPR